MTFLLLASSQLGISGRASSFLGLDISNSAYWGGSEWEDLGAGAGAGAVANWGIVDGFIGGSERYPWCWF